jgi:hypothetical protein
MLRGRDVPLIVIGNPYMNSSIEVNIYLSTISGDAPLIGVGDPHNSSIEVNIYVSTISVDAPLIVIGDPHNFLLLYYCYYYYGCCDGLDIYDIYRALILLYCC